MTAQARISYPTAKATYDRLFAEFSAIAAARGDRQPHERLCDFALALAEIAADQDDTAAALRDVLAKLKHCRLCEDELIHPFRFEDPEYEANWAAVDLREAVHTYIGQAGLE